MFCEQQLLALADKWLPEAGGDIRFERIRTGKFNTSYYVIAPSGEYVLRIAPPDDAVFCFYERKMMKQEPGIHRMLAEKTKVPVARIVAFDDTQSLIECDYMLMERLRGAALSEASSVDTEVVFEQVGRMLAECHALKAAEYGYLGEHRPMAPQADWVSAFRIMWRSLLDDVAGCGYYDDQQRAAMERLLEDRLAFFDRPVSASFLHMDIWHQNILVDGGGSVTGIIDWDRALWGDPEIEFAILDYCGVSTAGFWRGYGRERDTSPAAMVRRAFYLLYELQKYIVISHGRGNDPSSASAYKRQVMDVVRGSFG